MKKDNKHNYNIQIIPPLESNITNNCNILTHDSKYMTKKYELTEQFDTNEIINKSSNTKNDKNINEFMIDHTRPMSPRIEDDDKLKPNKY